MIGQFIQRFVIILLFLLQTTTYSKNHNDFIALKDSLNIDSVHLTVYDNLTKGMLSPNQQEHLVKIADTSLSASQRENFLHTLFDPTSYSSSASVTSHYNIHFDLYSSNELTVSVSISTYTNNVYLSKNSQQYEVALATPEFVIFYISLLEDLRFIDFIDASLVSHYWREF